MEIVIQILKIYVLTLPMIFTSILIYYGVIKHLTKKSKYKKLYTFGRKEILYFLVVCFLGIMVIRFMYMINTASKDVDAIICENLADGLSTVYSIYFIILINWYLIYAYMLYLNNEENDDKLKMNDESNVKNNIKVAFAIFFVFYIIVSFKFYLGMV